MLGSGIACSGDDMTTDGGDMMVIPDCCGGDLYGVVVFTHPIGGSRALLCV